MRVSYLMWLFYPAIWLLLFPDYVLSLYLTNTIVSLIHSFRRLLERYLMQTIALAISDIQWLFSVGYFPLMAVLFSSYLSKCVWFFFRSDDDLSHHLPAFQTRTLQASHSKIDISMIPPTLGERGMGQLLGLGTAPDIPKDLFMYYYCVTKN